MLNLSPRQVVLLNRLMDDRRMSIQDFAAESSVSSRTVYREINSLNNILSKYSVRVFSTEQGLSLKGSEEDRLNLRLMLPTVKSSVKSQTIKENILIELFRSDSPIKKEYFAKKFKFSSVTVSNYLKEIKGWLKNKNAHLVVKPGVGVYIVADEVTIRHVIVDLIFDHYGFDNVISIVEDYSAQSCESMIQDKLGNIRLMNIIDCETILTVKEALIKAKFLLSYYIDDRLYTEFVVRMAVALSRFGIGRKVEPDAAAGKELEGSDESKLAAAIARAIEEEKGTALPEEEIGYLAVLLQGLRCGSADVNFRDDRVSPLTEEIIAKSSGVFGVDFRKDPVLRHDLNAHLMSSIYRIKCGYTIRNPLIHDIKEKYSGIFYKVKDILRPLEDSQHISISEDEVGYIAMHLAASMERLKSSSAKFNALLVCANGIGISRMLLAKLNKVQELNIIGTSSILQLDEMIKSNHIDVVISTMPIKRSDVRVITINPLFSENDIRKLEKELDISISFAETRDSAPVKLDELRSIAEYSAGVYRLVRSNVFFSAIDSASVDETQEKMLEIVRSQRLINKRQSAHLKSLLNQREKLGSIVLPKKNFAIYHCVSEEITEAIVVVVRLNQPMTLINLLGKKETVTTTLMMIAPPEDKTILKVIGNLSLSIMGQFDVVDKLKECSDTQDCRKIIEDALLASLYDEIKKAVLAF